jgi:hypothetical protein
VSCGALIAVLSARAAHVSSRRRGYFHRCRCLAAHDPSLGTYDCGDFTRHPNAERSRSCGQPRNSLQDRYFLRFSGRLSSRLFGKIHTGGLGWMPRAGSYGRNTAAPLLFHIFDLLPPEPILPIAAQPNAGGPARRVDAALKHFIPSADAVSTAANREPPPRITFPPNGAHLMLAREGSSFAPLALEAMGGAPAYRWAVNGQPLACANWGANCLDAGWSRFCQDLGDGSPSQVHHRRSLDRVEDRRARVQVRIG